MFFTSYIIYYTTIVVQSIQKISQSLYILLIYNATKMVYNITMMRDKTKALNNLTEVNKMKVKAYSSQCIGVTITSLHYYGEIVKTNKKSIKVNFNRFVKTEGKKTVIDIEYNGCGTFTFWKTINRDDKMVDIYKNTTIGIIEIAR